MSFVTARQPVFVAGGSAGVGFCTSICCNDPLSG